MAKAKTIEEAPKDEYVFTLRMGGNSYVGKGATALEALENLEKPTKIFLKGVVVLAHGNHSTKEMVYTVPRLKRFFFPDARFHLAKNLELYLK